MGNGDELREHLRNEILEKRKVESTAIGWSREAEGWNMLAREKTT